MGNPILEEIWRVREMLVKKHGGIHAYLDYIQKLDEARLRRERRKRNKKATRPKAKSRGS